jgi:hypothetical protein
MPQCVLQFQQAPAVTKALSSSFPIRTEALKNHAACRIALVQLNPRIPHN